ncbi:MAG: glycosyltransferase family 2 protein [Acidobacteriota bacterium]|nr:glycosyltransferase family 2 protein [Acidobacteriota bacterium]
MTPLTFPVVPRPAVSIVMPTYGGWEWVERSLTAVTENTDPCYEMILVDNASPDGLAERLAAEVRNARLVRNVVNRGFGCANNQGAAYATGAALLFLNSDAFVHPGWLPPLLERLEQDDRTAAVGPRILNTDGSLQEAGSLLFQNGYSQFYGFGDEATRPEYRFARRVDYASAVCLLVRRRDFWEVGGFDAVYAPAYFEDVDLCLALAARGLATVYEPRSTVTHVRGASGDEQTAGEYWSRNLPVFEKRWSDVLASRPAFPADEKDLRARIAARDVRAPVRLLVAADRFSEPASAFEPRVLWLLRELATLYPDSRVTLLSPGDAPAGLLEPLAALGIEVASPKDLEAWLKARAFHYDVVLSGGGTPRTPSSSSSWRAPSRRRIASSIWAGRTPLRGGRGPAAAGGGGSASSRNSLPPTSSSPPRRPTSVERERSRTTLPVSCSRRHSKEAPICPAFPSAGTSSFSPHRTSKEIRRTPRPSRP